MNRTLALVAIAGLLGSVAAFAQTAATNSSSMPRAISSGDAGAKTAAAPVPGRNSFTRKQARSRLRDHGYDEVKDLKKDDQGVWHATAVKAGQPVGVTLDYQGNITEQ